MIEKLEAPWTEEQVIRLNERQRDPTRHPYTCGTKEKHAADKRGNLSTQLVATLQGWVCTECGYTQDWCHKHDAQSDAENLRELEGTMKQQAPATHQYFQNRITPPNGEVPKTL